MNDMCWAIVTAGCLTTLGLWLVYGHHCKDTFRQWNTTGEDQ